MTDGGVLLVFFFCFVLKRGRDSLGRRPAKDYSGNYPTLRAVMSSFFFSADCRCLACHEILRNLCNKRTDFQPKTCARFQNAQADS